MAPVGTNPAQFLDLGGESRLVTLFASPGPGWHRIGGMTEDYAKIGTALARGELAREPVPISTAESTSALTNFLFENKVSHVILHLPLALERTQL